MGVWVGLGGGSGVVLAFSNFYILFLNFSCCYKF